MTMLQRLFKKKFKAALLDRAAIDDFESIISSHFPCQKYFLGKTILGFEENVSALELVYSKKGRVTDIRKTRQLTQEIQEAIVDHLEHDLFGEPQWTVGRTYVFASRPIEGHFRRGEEWQLLPLPRDAPRSNQANGPHPGLLEYRYRNSSDDWTRISRQRRTETRIFFLLSGLLQTHLRRQSISPQKLWMLGDNEPHFTSQLKQTGYSYPAPNPLPEGFTEVSEFSEMQAIEPELYYSDELQEGFRLKVPSDLHASLDLFEELGTNEQEQFLRACYWSTHTLDVQSLSYSSATIAAVTALEALGPLGAKSRGPGNEITGATRTFNVVLNTLLGQSLLAELDPYEIRSNLAHGSVLLDEELRGWNMGANGRKQDWTLRFLQSVLPIALNRWLRPDMRARLEAAVKAQK